MQRYGPTGFSSLNRNPNGQYILYADHQQAVAAVNSDNCRLHAKCDELERENELFRWLIEEAGFFQDDSATAIKISPDDATRTWHFECGKTKGFGGSIRSAIRAAREAAAEASGAL